MTTINFEGRPIVRPSRSNKDLVIILVAASLLTIAICTFPFTLRLTLTAIVASSSSLFTKLASFSVDVILLEAYCIPPLYCGNRWAACPTVSPLGKFWRYSVTLNSVKDLMGAKNIFDLLLGPLMVVLLVGILVLALYSVFLLSFSSSSTTGPVCVLKFSSGVYLQPLLMAEYASCSY